MENSKKIDGLEHNSKRVYVKTLFLYRPDLGDVVFCRIVSGHESRPLVGVNSY